ncbi:hypothetical protein E6C27_scaffold133G001210 [Cucumis melo var. makuwa]|uniref:Putative plant transposon protein domain-containing protein n=1 Tax=Cucumis melo var. makuwa TaxID=1194695 RepID=A0A5A7U0U4_CUCMM|nr:hypothetical protein E6C27_scaffold133G001210 [Cucumis melo var. makuwa]
MKRGQEKKKVEEEERKKVEEELKKKNDERKQVEEEKEKEKEKMVEEDDCEKEQEKSLRETEISLPIVETKFERMAKKAKKKTKQVKSSLFKIKVMAVNAIRPSMVNLFYRGYINTEEHYAEVKGKRINFGPSTINVIYGLKNNGLGHGIFKNPKDRNLQEALEKAKWSGTKWDQIPTYMYQLFPHNLTTEASVWLVFIKKNIMPTHHDNIISMERIMLLYYIIMEILVNVGEIICEHLTAGVKHPREAQQFSRLIKQLLKRQGEEEALGLKKAKIPKARDSKEIFPPALLRSLTKKKLPSPDTSNHNIFHETFSDRATLLDDATRESEEGKKEKEVLKETVDDPPLVQI